MTTEVAEATPDYARQLTDRIRIAVEGTWQLVAEAYQSRTWASLGYQSWDDYCTREFGNSRLKLPREDRAEQVASLRESGLSLRAISAATGADKNTIMKDLRHVSEIQTPEPERRTTTIQGGAAWVNPGEEIPVDTETEIDLDTHEVVSEKIIGMDGKQYSRPEPVDTQPRQPAITNQFSGAVVDINKAMAKLVRITESNNYRANHKAIAELHRSDLTRTINTLQTILEELN